MAARSRQRLSTATRLRSARKAAPPVPPPPGTPVREVPCSHWIGEDGSTRRDLPPDELKEVVEAKKGQLWVEIDVSHPGQVATLSKVFGFHPLTIEDTQNPESRIKVEEFPGYLFVIIRGVRFLTATEDPYDLETYNMCFYIGPNYVVTVHGGQSVAVRELGTRIERNPELLRRGPGRLAHVVMDAAIDAYFPVLDQIDEFVDGLEERVFNKADSAALHDIFSVKRLVLSLRRHLAPQREVFGILTNRPLALLPPEVQVYYRDIYDHILRINDAMETYRELLSSTLDAYLTQASNRLGQVTKGLTMVATVSIPFVVVSGMWGMNVAELPLAQHAHAFWWMLGIQLGLGAVLLLLLRWRGLV